MDASPGDPASSTGRFAPEPVVALVGASGLVGDVLLRLLEARSFPVARLLPCAGPGSRSGRVRFRGEELPLLAASSESLAQAELVFFAATGELSRALAPELARRGATVIDKSSTWRLAPDVPLVVPEVNARQIGAARLVACPNCTTIGLVMALEPLRRAAGLARVQVTTLQSASGAGRAGLERLRAEAAGREPTPDPSPPFPGPLYDNVLPQCEALLADGETAEEHKLRDETRKILGLPELELSSTCVRVPVGVGHSAAVTVETVETISVGEARRVLGSFPGIRLADLPTPRAAAGRDEVLVGRIRAIPGRRGIQFFQASDNLRKGAATNALQIAEFLLARRA
jgi:aspartate-semialdehyde dehydrogenase